MRARMALLAVLGSGLVAAPATAQTATVTQQLFDASGDPSLVANSRPYGHRGTISWRVCPDGITCAPATWAPGSRFDPGPTATGTVFEAVVTYRGRVTTDRSTPWRGRVTATAPPSIAGIVAVGSLIRPLGGSWIGGWGGEFDTLRLEACETAVRQGCATIAEVRDYENLDGSIRLAARHAGCFVFAVDRRLAPGTLFTADWRSVESIPPVTPGQTVAISAPVEVPGTGCAPQESRQLDDLPPHPVQIHVNARRERGTVTVGRVRCAMHCDVSFSVSDGRRTLRRSLTVQGSAPLAVKTNRLRPGTLTVIVEVNGRHVRGGQTRLRR